MGAHSLMAAEASSAKILIFFLIWYAINVIYNDMNKTVLKVLDLPWTMACLQLGLGLLYVGPLWLTGLKKAPRLSADNLATISPIALIHGLGQCVTVMSLSAGSVALALLTSSPLLAPPCPLPLSPLLALHPRAPDGVLQRCIARQGRALHVASVPLRSSPSSMSSSRSSPSSMSFSVLSSWATCCPGRHAVASPQPWLFLAPRSLRCPPRPAIPLAPPALPPQRPTLQTACWRRTRRR